VPGCAAHPARHSQPRLTLLRWVVGPTLALWSMTRARITQSPSPSPQGYGHRIGRHRRLSIVSPTSSPDDITGGGVRRHTRHSSGSGTPHQEPDLGRSRQPCSGSTGAPALVHTEEGGRTGAPSSSCSEKAREGLEASRLAEAARP
jgi:hypothetical protein